MTDREQFEAWVKSRGGSAMKRDGRYIESMTRLWAECWIACSNHYESRLADLSLRWKNYCEEVEQAARRAEPENKAVDHLTVEHTATGVTIKPDHSPERIAKLYAGLEQIKPEEVEPVAWYTEDYLTDKSATTYSAEVAQRWRDKGWPVWALYAASHPQEQK